MHELSLALNIVEIAEEKAKEKNASEIEEIELEIGRLAGVELQTFFFALESAVKGTILDKAHIVRHIIDGEGRCSDCGKTVEMTSLLTPCPACGSYLINILKGKELKIKSLLIK
ncbi:MAG: hydrogenase maturation nickel metallochaperone HypA [Tannerella sp.]|jgi:hydrogenase nickel incorporation protein HypA/HybF|nr:hydrogenase maturation nickel metallochaperone HypA [Tannerella sp.]